MRIIQSVSGGRGLASEHGFDIANALDEDRLQSLDDIRSLWPSVVDLALRAFPGALE
jgi:hypothetical protein